MNRLLYGLILMMLLIASACLDEIAIENADRPEDGYVVQAKLISGNPSYVEVKVEQLFFYTSNINRPVNDALVSLVKKTGERFEFQEVPLDGIYSAYLEQADFPVEVGQSYRIEVEITPEIKLQSDWDQIFATPKADNISWDFTEIETVSTDGLLSRSSGIQFSITTPIITATEKARLRWEFIDAYRVTDDLNFTCYIENSYQNNRLFLLDGNTVGPDTITNYPLFSDQLGIRHIDGYYLSVFQQALSPEAFTYWEQVSALLEREGTVFDNPAGAINTNIRNLADSTQLVYGFFSAYTQDTLRRFLSREEMGNLDFYCPRPPTNQVPPPITVCDGCIDALGASYNKPYYWQ
ncbi:DUF4249 domain-containing protein [Lewinella sp. LCG006]|uniref:DUF4249 domain-containing protein n=1 Tax=Lewinella sp. LCG006 TaxID=3231911 RepID=UPI00345F7198